jgi:outer membrane PBP1 activator LpoA protein
MEKKILNCIIIMMTCILISSCSSVSSPDLLSSSSSSTLENTHTQTSLWTGTPLQVWTKILQISSIKLADMQASTQDSLQSGWIQLARVAKQKNSSTPQFANALMTWRERYPDHPANVLLPSNSTLMQLQTSTPQQIAVLLPQTGPYRASGHAVREGILNAYYTTQASKQNIKFYDTHQTASMTALYQQAISEGADFIIGPLLKENVQQLLETASFTKPTLALNYTDAYFGSLPSHFYEFGLLPEDEASQIARHARQAGRSHAIVIAPKNAWGERLVSAFTSRWQAMGGHIQEAWYFSSQAQFNQEIARLLHINTLADKKLMQKNNNKAVLEQQRRQDFDVVFLFAPSQQAHVIVPLLRYYYVSDIPIYSTSSVYAGKSNPAQDVDLNGVTVCDIPSAAHTHRLYAVGQDAYRLSQSLQRLVLLPLLPLYGATGALILTPQHKIHRRLPCVVIHHGHL